MAADIPADAFTADESRGGTFKDISENTQHSLLYVSIGRRLGFGP